MEPVRFTTEQYNKAIEALQLGRQQLEPDGKNCTICGDSGHQAFECGFNPLFAMILCKTIADDAEVLHKKLHESNRVSHKDQVEKLHEIVHYLAGHNRYMGEQTGPARIRVPDGIQA